MIRINLLPREKHRKKARVKVSGAVIVATAVFAVGGMLGYWVVVKGDVAQLRADIVATRDEITRDQQIVRMVEQYTRDKQQLQDRLGLVQQLAGNQDSPVRLLDGISQALPDGGWLTGISKVSEKLLIRGYASSHFVVAELMLALQRLKPTVSSVELNFAELELYETRPVERFEILVILSR